MGVICQCYALATLVLGKRASTHCTQRLVGHQDGLDGCKKFHAIGI
jgi:hypothetical protein